jgi:hypothetical protein
VNRDHLSNQPGDKAQLFELGRTVGGALKARFELPGPSEELFEMSAVGLIDDENLMRTSAMPSRQSTSKARRRLSILQTIHLEGRVASRCRRT